MIIKSILDVDLYKLTVGQVLFTHFANIDATYRMTIRNGHEIKYWTYVQDREFEKEIQGLSELSLTQKEADDLKTLGLFTEEYLEFLMNKPFDVRGDLRFTYQDKTFNTPVPIAQGKWFRVMLYETLCLSIGNEIFARNYCLRNNIDMVHVEATAMRRLEKKIADLVRYKTHTYDNDYRQRARSHPIELNIVEFGTRRRLSRSWQETVVKQLHAANLISGTSNVHLAFKLGIPAKGTFGHEFTMGMQGLGRIQDSQVEAFRLWLNHWKGKLAIALDDTFGNEKFMKDFSYGLATAFDGLRHDSGDPYAWARARIQMYERFDIDPKTKTLFFSDGLNTDKIISLDREFGDKAKLGFGIGTDLTNDSFIPVPQAVMKLINCNGQDVAKLSNNPDKACCDNSAYLEYVKSIAK